MGFLRREVKPAFGFTTAEAECRCYACLAMAKGGDKIYRCSCTTTFHQDCLTTIIDCPKCKGRLPPAPSLNRVIVERKSARPAPPPERKPEPRAVVSVAEQDYEHRCNICIEIVSRGDYIVLCKCGRAFHVSCAADVGICPKCGGAIGGKGIAERKPGAGVCEKCSRDLGGEEWKWLCLCSTGYHLDCAKRVQECMKCNRKMDWADGRMQQADRKKREVRLLAESLCPVCREALKKEEVRVECTCGTAYHPRCVEEPTACRRCKVRVVGVNEEEGETAS